jgi:hypothetical protein
MRSFKLPLFLTLLATLAAFFSYLVLTGKDYQTYVAEHAHTHVAPHGGTLLVLGDHLGHLELLLDSESGSLTAYALDGHAEHPVRLKAKSIGLNIKTNASSEWHSLTLEARSNPLTGEVVGDSSEFALVSPELIGETSFALKLESLQFRGVDVPAFETRFPEGNELAQAPGAKAGTTGGNNSGD